MGGGVRGDREASVRRGEAPGEGMPYSVMPAQAGIHVGRLSGHRPLLLASDIDPSLRLGDVLGLGRSEEHTSELQSLMRISYAVFRLKKKKNTHVRNTVNNTQIFNTMLLITSESLVYT